MSTETVRGGETIPGDTDAGVKTGGRNPGSSGQGNRSGAETVGSTENVGRDPGDIDAYTMRKKGSLDPDDFPGFKPEDIPGRWSENVGRDPGDTGV